MNNERYNQIIDEAYENYKKIRREINGFILIGMRTIH
jgi:hypothetical protein